jgi:hypothetical protein
MEVGNPFNELVKAVDDLAASILLLILRLP